MDATEFVDAFTQRVFRSAVTNTIRSLEKPPGRRPPADRIQASAWFGTLAEPDRALVEWVIADAAHSASFGALAVIDGERPTGPYRYELVAVDEDGSRSLVNPETSADLHDLFQNLVMLPDGRLRLDVP